jgi:hypothetical protein
MGVSTEAYVFFGIDLDPEDEWGGDWPEPYSSSGLGGTLAAVDAFLRAKLGREPTRDECRAFDSPGRRYDGVYLRRGPKDAEYRDDLSVVFPLEGGYAPGESPVLHPFLAVRATYQKGNDGGGAMFDPSLTQVDAATLDTWRAALREFCELATLPYREPQWYMTVYTS